MYIYDYLKLRLVKMLTTDTRPWNSFFFYTFKKKNRISLKCTRMRNHSIDLQIRIYAMVHTVETGGSFFFGSASVSPGFSAGESRRSWRFAADCIFAKRRSCFLISKSLVRFWVGWLWSGKNANILCCFLSSLCLASLACFGCMLNESEDRKMPPVRPAFVPSHTPPAVDRENGWRFRSSRLGRKSCLGEELLNGRRFSWKMESAEASRFNLLETPPIAPRRKRDFKNFNHM